MYVYVKLDQNYLLHIKYENIELWTDMKMFDLFWQMKNKMWYTQVILAYMISLCKPYMVRPQCMVTK